MNKDNASVDKDEMINGAKMFCVDTRAFNIEDPSSLKFAKIGFKLGGLYSLLESRIFLRAEEFKNDKYIERGRGGWNHSVALIVDDIL